MAAIIGHAEWEHGNSLQGRARMSAPRGRGGRGCWHGLGGAGHNVQGMAAIGVGWALVRHYGTMHVKLVASGKDGLLD